MIKKRTLYVGVIIGTVVSLVAMIILCVVFGSIINTEKIKEERIEVLGWMIAAISAFIGSIIAGKCVNERIAIACGCAGVLEWGVLLFFNIFVFDAGFSRIFPIAISVAVGAIVGCAICCIKGNKRKVRVR